jgi:simple sugar transport system ATP-binding protein
LGLHAGERAVNADVSIALEMDDVSVRFPGVQALAGVAFRAQAGRAHALVGANGAGKTTLMRVLGGAHADYSGRIRLGGEEVRIRSPRDARALGIQVVHQEVDAAVVPTLSVGENVMLDALVHGMAGRHLVRWRALHAEAARVLARLGVALDPRRRLSGCTLAEKQLVVIARALASDCQFLVLDEPTAPLSATETAELFRVLRGLRDRGLGLVFVSHRLGELAEVCDDVTVLRDGRRVAHRPLAGLPAGELVELMLGRRAAAPTRIAHRAGAPGPELLEVRDLADGGRLRGVSLCVRAGEVVGLAGLLGAGKTELCKALFGASPSRGALTLRGRPYRPRDPAAAVRAGLALVPEERRAQGVLVDETVAVNLTAASLDRHAGLLGILSAASERAAARALIARLGIRTPSERQRVALLSGGNQQKVAVGKWLAAEADLYLFDEPTKGVDVGAREELLGLVGALAAAGKGVLYASSDPDELLAVCHRIYVLRGGRVVAELSAADTDAAALFLHCAGGSAA